MCLFDFYIKKIQHNCLQSCNSGNNQAQTMASANRYCPDFVFFAIMKCIYSGLLLLLTLSACNNSPDRSDTTQTSENEVDAARNFIRLALDGKWDDARRLIIEDSLNKEYMDLAEQNYKQRIDLATRNGYRGASIIIRSVDELSDSTSIVRYSNSFKKQEDSLKVVRSGDKWLIDLKYSFPATKSVQ